MTLAEAHDVGGSRPTYDPPPFLAKWLLAANRVAEELRRSGAERDRLGAAPHAEIALLRRAGLLTVLEPIRHGGGGARWSEAMLLVRRVARGDTSIGQLLGYHYLHCRVHAANATLEQQESLARRSVTEGWYWAGAVNPRDPDLLLSAAGEGFVLNGRKTFATGSRVADYLTVRASLDGAAVQLAVPAGRAGIVANDDWNNIGQRLTESGSIEFHDVQVGRDEILGGFPSGSPQPLSPAASLSTPMMQLNFVNFYLGTAEGALAEAREYVLQVTRPWNTSGVAAASDDPYILELYGHLSSELRAALALANEAGAAIDAADARGTALTRAERDEVAALVYAAKVNSTRVSLDVTARVFELMGARATASRYGFDRYWRNIRTHTVHDPVAYKAREVGNHALNGRITPDPLYT